MSETGIELENPEQDRKLETPELLMHEFNASYYAKMEAEKAKERQIFIHDIKLSLSQLYDAIETAREHGVKCSILIPVNGKPTLQVEE